MEVAAPELVGAQHAALHRREHEVVGADGVPLEVLAEGLHGLTGEWYLPFARLRLHRPQHRLAVVERKILDNGDGPPGEIHPPAEQRAKLTNP